MAFASLELSGKLELLSDFVTFSTLASLHLDIHRELPGCETIPPKQEPQSRPLGRPLRRCAHKRNACMSA